MLMTMGQDRSGELPTERSAPEDEQLVDVYSLTIVQGPDAGATHTLGATSPGRMLLGKSPICALRVTDPEVSRRHASFRVEDGALILMDLGSMNGTLVNGVAIREASLRGGETVRAGSTVLAVSRGTPSFVSLAQEASFGRILGESHPMRALYPVLHQVSARDFAVLLEGEIGVGKYLCAEEIHLHSPRAAHPFVPLSCTSIPLDAIEARIFGSGGVAEEAGSGTVYIDEIANLPDALQRRLASLVTPEADGPRFLFGTRLDLDREVTAGRFRDDFLGELAPRRIELPPLRERPSDVGLLAAAFWRSLVTDLPSAPDGGKANANANANDDADPSRESPDLPADFLPRFHNYRWPGNVTELARAVCTRFCLGEFGRWRPSPVSQAGEDAFAAVLDRELPFSEARQLVIQEFEQRYVKYMLARHGTTTSAAKASGLAKRYFQVLHARFRG
jgi:two-component system, NtrC family, response regulator HydG